MLTIALRLLVSLRFQVLFHSLYQGTFHLSLTVLVLYRSLCVFSLGRWSSQLHTVLACTVLLRFPVSKSLRFYIPGSHLLWLAVPHHSTRVRFSYFFTTRPYYPFAGSLQLGLGFSRFARHYFGNPSLFLWVLRCFSSPGSPFYTMYSCKNDSSALSDFSIRISWNLSLVHSSSRLFAVSHVLLRHKAPRHPP